MNEYRYVAAIKRTIAVFPDLKLSVCKRAIDCTMEKYDIEPDGTLTELQMYDTKWLLFHLMGECIRLGLNVWTTEIRKTQINEAFRWAMLSHCDHPPMLPLHPKDSRHASLYNPFIVVSLASEIIKWRMIL